MPEHKPRFQGSYPIERFIHVKEEHPVKVISSFVVAILFLGSAVHSDPRTAALDSKPGLDKTITLSLRAASLREVLDKVQAQTGVRLRPERDIAEDKATIWVKEKPAREVLRALARCFNLCWVESEVGSSRFLRLFMDRDSDADLRRREYDDYQAIVDQFDKELKANADVIRSNQDFRPPADATGISRDEYDRLLRRSRAATWSEYAAATLQFLALSESQRKDLMAGKHVMVSGSAIAEEALKRKPDLTSIDFWIERSLGGYLLRCCPQPFIPTSIMLATAVFDDSRYEKTIQAANDKLLKDTALDREVQLPGRKDGAPSPISVPTPPAVNARGDQQVSGKVTDASQYILPGVLRPGEGSGATPATMSDGLLAITEAAEVPIIAQYLSEYAGAADLAPGLHAPVKINARISELCLRHQFTVERDADFLLAKSLLWHRLRSREVPEEKIKRWQRIVTGLPAPTLEAAVEMGSLSWGQVRGVINNSRYWFGIPDPSYLARCEYVLKLYASLTPNQQGALRQGTEIPVSTLKPEQQYIFMQAYEVKEQPTFEHAQDPSWPQTAAFSLVDGGLEDQMVLYATADMRSLGGTPLTVESTANMTSPPPGEMTADQRLQLYETAKRRAEQQISEAAKTFAQQIAKQHPDISPGAIGIHVQRILVFTLRLGDDEQPKMLTYAVRVDH